MSRHQNINIFFEKGDLTKNALVDFLSLIILCTVSKDFCDRLKLSNIPQKLRFYKMR